MKKKWKRVVSSLISIGVLSAVMMSFQASGMGMTFTREYVKYDCITGVKTEYDLSLDANSTIGTRAIIKPDDRVYSDREENTGIDLMDGTNNIGTGFIIGDHTIATAAHCTINDNSFSGFKTQLRVNTYNVDGTSKNDGLLVREIHMPSDYYYGNFRGAEHADYDYALLTVAEDLSDYVHFSLGDAYDVRNSDFANVPLHVTGVPDEYNGEENTEKRIVTGEGNVWTKAPSEYVEDIFRHDVDTWSGQSGSPVYVVMKCTSGTEVSYTFTAVAVHNGGNSMRNRGARINQQLMMFYGEQNPYIFY